MHIFLVPLGARAPFQSEILSKNIQTGPVPGSGGGGGREVVHHCTRLGPYWKGDRASVAYYYFLSFYPTYPQITYNLLCFSLHLNSEDGFPKLYKVVLNESNGEVLNNIQHVYFNISLCNNDCSMYWEAMKYSNRLLRRSVWDQPEKRQIDDIFSIISANL